MTVGLGKIIWPTKTTGFKDSYFHVFTQTNVMILQKVCKSIIYDTDFFETCGQWKKKSTFTVTDVLRHTVPLA